MPDSFRTGSEDDDGENKQKFHSLLAPRFHFFSKCLMHGSWHYPLKAASEQFSPWMCDAPGAEPELLAGSAAPDDGLARLALLPESRPLPRTPREACDAEPPRSKVTVNSGTSVSIVLPFFSSTQSWMERMLPFSMKVQLPSPFSSCASNIYAACFSLVCSLVMMRCLTRAVHPCAWGDPSWPKEDLSPATVLRKRQAELCPLPSATPG